MKIQVECYAGYRGEETPRRIAFGAQPIEVAEVLDCWLAPDHRYFKVRGDDGSTEVSLDVFLYRLTDNTV